MYKKIFLVGIVVVALVFIFFTRSSRMPDVLGQDLKSAFFLLRSLGFRVLVDSAYDPNAKEYAILKQLPAGNSLVRVNETTVHLTIQQARAPMIRMPNLLNLSFRSAAMILHANKLTLGDTTERSDISAGAVLEQRYKGAVIKQGELIPENSKVDLAIGNGTGLADLSVPDLTGMTVEEATVILYQYDFVPVFERKDRNSTITDTPSAFIVDQQPRKISNAGEHEHLKAGATIKLIIRQ